MADRKLLELPGDATHREPVQFLIKPDGSLFIHIDGGEGGDTEQGFYGIEAERTFSPDEVARLLAFLQEATK